MKKHSRAFLISLGYALDGLREAFKHEMNMRIHVFLTLLALTAGLYFKLNPNEWMWLSVTITLVLFAELMNTALEANVDLVTKEKKPEAKTAKDVAAAAVLITSLNALIVGYVLFGTKFLGH